MKFKYLLISILFLVFFLKLNAQNSSKTDSLLRVLKTAKEDEKKILLLYEVGLNFETTDLEKSKSYYRQARKLGKKIKYSLSEFKFISNYTFSLNMQGKLDSSLYWNLRGIEEAKKLKSDEYLAKAYFNTGTSYQYLTDYQSAVENYQKGLALFEKLDNELLKAQANDILTVLYTSMKNFKKAKKHGKLAVQQFQKLDQPQLYAYSLSNLGVVYGDSNQKDSSLIYHQQAEQIAKKINDEVLLATVNLNLGDVYLWKKQFETAKKHHETALQYARKNQLSDVESVALRGLSYYFMEKGDFAKSQEFAEKALEISQKNNLREEKVFNLNQMTALAYVSRDIDKAGEYEIQSKNLRDSILNEQIINATINTEKRFELDKKNTKLQLQEEKINRKNLLNWLLIGGLVALLTIAILGYRNYNHRKKIQEQKITKLETEKQLLATQSLLKGQEEERTRISKDLHDGLGGLLSGVKLQLGAMKGNLILTEENGNAFNRALNKLDESISEMRRVAHNMMPETLLKFGLQQALTDYSNGLSQGQNFTIDCEFFGVENRLENSVEIVVYRIVQELINNAVKHSEATKILVQVMRHDKEHLNITVEDNGKGFNFEEMKTKNSAGLQNIQSRVNYLNGKMDIQSEIGKGTSVYIECDLNQNG